MALVRIATFGVLGQSAKPGISSRRDKKRERRSFLRLRSRKLCALRLSVSSQSDDWGLERWDRGRAFMGEPVEEGDEGDVEEVGDDALEFGDSDRTPETVT